MFSKFTTGSDRLKGESRKSYNYFCLYRDKFPRPTITDFAQSIGMSSTRIYHLSSAYNWAQRIEQWDKQNRQSLDSNKLHNDNTIDSKRIELYKLLEEKILQRLKSIDADTLTPRDISALLNCLDKIESKLQPQIQEQDNDKSTELLNILVENLSK